MTEMSLHLQEQVLRAQEAAQHMQLSEQHLRPIMGLLSGEVMSPRITAHQAGDLAGFVEYDSELHAGLRTDPRISRRLGKPMVRENERTVQSNFWVLSDMAGERHLKNPGFMSEFGIALQVGACGLFAASRENTPQGFVLTNGYTMTGTKSSEGSPALFIDAASGLAMQAADIADRRFAAANTPKPKRGFMGRGSQPTPEIPMPTIGLQGLLEQSSKLQIHDSLIFVVSDFRDTIGREMPGWLPALAHLGGSTGQNNNTLIAVETVNPEDFVLGAATTTVVDPRTGRVLPTSQIGSGGKSSEYTKYMTEWTDNMRGLIRRAGIGHIVLHAEQPNPLQSFLAQMGSQRPV